MCRPNLSLLLVLEALQVLLPWLTPQMPLNVWQPNEKASDAELVATALLQRSHKLPYFSCWWNFVKLNFCPHWPGLTQANTRLERLLPIIEAISVEIEDLAFCVIDSLALRVARSKRATRCKVRGATMGYGTQGSVYGFKCHAWSTLNGKLAQCVIRPANQHDLIAGYELNMQWVAYGRSGVLMGVRSRR